MADDFKILRTASDDPLASTVPIIIATVREPTDEDLRCFEEGAVDFMMKPYRRTIVKKRIENAIHVKSDQAFHEVETMLRQLPSNIFLKDAQGRYVFATHYWHHLEMGDDPNWTIRGKTDLEIRKDRDNAIKAMQSDMEVVRTGEGTNYIIEINVDGIQEFLELIKRPVFDLDGNVTGVIVLANDVTEKELLKRELQRRAHTDELTGLGNHRSFSEFLEEIPHSKDFPIAVISADCDMLKLVNDSLGHQVGDHYIRMVAAEFATALPKNARAFRTGGDEFMAFLPGTTKEQADEIVSVVQDQCEFFELKGQGSGVSCGTSLIESPSDNLLSVIGEADRAMYANKKKRKKERAK
jgi:diguanylate cyclase (GGDEF)-like protein